jgi:putative glutamine amidotransferase
VIGISTYREPARWGVWEDAADLLPAAYARAVEAAGGVPVLLPPQAADDAEVIVGRLDGLVIAGGADVDPGLYRARPHARTTSWRPDRDSWELALLAAADALDLPVLGVCRGLQLMAVWAGGTLEQHVPDRVGTDDHAPAGPVYGTVLVDTVPGSLTHRLVGDRLEVACHHHQSVAMHPGWVVAATAFDGTIEALEDPSLPFRLGVQWHPETLTDYALFSGLVAAASSSRREGRAVD